MTRKTEGPELATIRIGSSWQIAYHRLLRLSPDRAGEVATTVPGVTIWHLSFNEDLLQIINPDRGLLVDVGWYPDSDPTGAFGLVIVRRREEGEDPARPSYDWRNPLFEFRTRSVEDLVAEIEKHTA